MKNNKIQFLLIFIITVSSSNAFGIDYFWLANVPLKDGSLLGGIEVGEMENDKVKRFFNKELSVFDDVEVNGVLRPKIKEAVLSNKIFTFDEEYNSGGDHVGIKLTRSLAVRAEDGKKISGYIAISAKHKVEDVKILNLVKSKNENEIYLNAVKENKGGVLSAKDIAEVLSGGKHFSIFSDPENPRFATDGEVLFLDKKPVFYNFHGFSPFFNESRSIGFLFKVDGRLCLLARFGYSMQRKGWIEKMPYDYYLIDLEKARGYLPMHLREEK